MNELLVFLQSLPEAFKTGFIYSIMVMGVYLTYKILDFPDMSVDGTFPLGGFVFAAFALSKNGFFGITSPIMGLILAVVCGMIAGYITGALHVYLKINGLLSGILVMTGLYSINSRIVGMPNVFISPERRLDKIWTPKNTGVMLPMTQIPAEKLKLPEFAWFEELRPTDPQDVFHWRGKGEGSALKVIQRRRSPQQKVNTVSR